MAQGVRSGRTILAVLLGAVLLGGIGLAGMVYVYREAVAIRGIALLRQLLPQQEDPFAGIPVIGSSIYTLRIETATAPVDPGQGGALAIHDDAVFLVTRRGAFHRLNADETAFEPIGLEPPNAAITDTVFYSRNKDFAGIGYKDLILRPDGDGVELLLSQARIDPERMCVALVVSRARLAPEALAPGGPGAAAEWEEIWESQPCLTSPENTFPYQAGGDMALLPDGGLAVFVGDYGIDTFNRALEDLGPQDPGHDYGKVMRIDLASGEAAPLTLGQRNPGGLVVDAEGRIWTAEHGPQGGDELNLIAPGANYGWPLESYGTHYGADIWPPDSTPGDHRRFTRPIYSFVPSVATSSLALATGTEFPLWEGDLLMATLKAQTLYRFRIREGRVIVAEPIPVGFRIRDIALDSRGRIFLKDDTEGAVVILSEATGGGGVDVPQVLAQACSGCHQLAPGTAPNPAGPTLVGVLGRDIASHAGYEDYSDGLLAVAGTWTPEALTAYLTDPQGFAPGTTMPAPDLDAEGIEAAVAALAGSGG